MRYSVRFNKLYLTAEARKKRGGSGAGPRSVQMAAGRGAGPPPLRRGRAGSRLPQPPPSAAAPEGCGAERGQQPPARGRSGPFRAVPGAPCLGWGCRCRPRAAPPPPQRRGPSRGSGRGHGAASASEGDRLQQAAALWRAPGGRGRPLPGADQRQPGAGRAAAGAVARGPLLDQEALDVSAPGRRGTGSGGGNRGSRAPGGSPRALPGLWGAGARPCPAQPATSSAEETGAKVVSFPTARLAPGASALW